eukprot:CAMPEP_0168526268 /NCGR_PEP_ID=MMETSP0405-20121227/11860_1 /TAXON_ID=498012 /ORGANISM="Trichosphaerium sp, Strain Am-I-7 wt" /LENGTH=535 /DNA_ID=CAMNT_0008549065 /DNA_START=330 /DNA_END=1937 /DNA_ORIENTATION=+
MNLFNYDHGRKCLIAEGWCPKAATEEIQLALRRAKDRSGALVPSIMSIMDTKEQPPTYYKTNKFTSAFQGIVDAYGIARYGEVNPTPFTIITFPFLFAVMFGDVGHGFMMLAFALFMLWKEKEWTKNPPSELFQMAFDGRYIVVLMSCFAIFTGFMYNEFFSVPMDLFGSSWEIVSNCTAEQQNANFTCSEGYYYKYWNNTGVRGPYPFGADPVWKGNENELLYYNSLKMKLSIILGVSQMVLGLILKLLNGIHFRKKLDIFFEFIPQITFMMALFGYTCFIIFYKWYTPFYYNDRQRELGIVLSNATYGADCPMHPSTTEAPQLLNILIYLVLGFWDDTKSKCLYPNQLYIQGVLVFLAIVSVPLMLLVKPLALRSAHNKKLQNKGQYHQVEDEESEEEEEEFDFSDMFVHQVIETIEFVLGCVSHTASYLRLWALSLAHSELATVFWGMLLVQVGVEGVGKGVVVGAFTTFFCWAAWLGCTIAVLLVMESLSAFLHALRLHWVEFQSKFYYGDGHKFTPFSYARIFSGAADED